MSLNIVTMLGRLTKDPEVKILENEKAVANFTIAVDDGFGETKKTYFFRCSAWGKIAETIGDHVRKGHRLVVQGKLMQHSFVDKDGNNKSVVDVRVAGFDFIERKQKEESKETPISEINSMEGLGEETEVGF